MQEIKRYFPADINRHIQVAVSRMPELGPLRQFSKFVDLRAVRPDIYRGETLSQNNPLVAGKSGFRKPLDLIALCGLIAGDETGFYYSQGNSRWKDDNLTEDLYRTLLEGDPFNQRRFRARVGAVDNAARSGFSTLLLDGELDRDAPADVASLRHWIDTVFIRQGISPTNLNEALSVLSSAERIYTPKVLEAISSYATALALPKAPEVLIAVKVNGEVEEKARQTIIVEDNLRLRSSRTINGTQAPRPTREKPKNPNDLNPKAGKVNEIEASRRIRHEQQAEKFITEARNPKSEAAQELSEFETFTESSSALYLRDISKVRLLTAEEEVTLAKQKDESLALIVKISNIYPGFDVATDIRNPIKSGRWIDSKALAAKYGVDEADVSLLIQGEVARNKMIEANLRLVVSVARKYLGRGLPMLDLTQEGNLGLMRGVDKYDWRKGFRFSTYAYWWIRQAVTRAIADQARTIRVPVHMVEKISHYRNVKQELVQVLGREPSDVELSEEMGVPVDMIALIKRAYLIPISTEIQLHGEDDPEMTVGSLIPDKNTPSAHETAQNEILREELNQAFIELLTSREQAVLRRRFGLVDGHEWTLGEIGKDLGLSRERIRQIEAEAFAKLRHPRFRAKFKAYLD